MQKKVLAAAIGAMLVAPAVFADSANVTISGRLSAGLESYKLSGGTRGPYSNEMRLSDQSSSIVFSGTEDLGGGQKAWFQIDSRFDIPGKQYTFDTSGNTLFGLAGSWGKLGIGRSDLHYNETNVLGGITRSSSLQNWLAPGPFSQVNGTAIASGTRTSNVIMWDSNDMGGLTARIAYSTAPFSAEGSGVATVATGPDGSKGDAITGALRYNAGPLLAGVSYWDAKPEGAGSSKAGEQKSTKAWAGYGFGAIKVGLGYDSSEARPAAGASMAKRTAWLVPVTFTSGAETFQVSYTKIGKLSGVATTDNTDAQAYSLAWDHALSKRTSVGVAYTKLDNKANAAYNLFAIGASGDTSTSATAPGEDATQIYIGLAHFY